MRARLRTAWKATCGSSAHACTQRSPPVRSRVELVAGQRGQRRAAAAGRGAASPKRLVEQRGAEPEGHRQARRREARAPRRCRCGGASCSRWRRPAGRPAVMRAAASRPRAQQLAQVWRAGRRRRRRRRSAAGPAPAWRCPAWWRAVERRPSRRPPLAVCGVAASRPSAKPAARRRGDRRRPRRTRAGLAASGAPSLRRQRSRGACESGSASASIACAELAPAACQ